LNQNIIKSYLEDFGLQSNSFEQFCGARYNEKIILGGINGLTIIDPGKLKPNYNYPRLFINRIVVETEKNRSDSFNLMFFDCKIPTNALQTTIYFSGINFSSPEHTTFWYRITNRSKEWINLNTQNFVTLIGLPPDTYHLEIKAANEDGIWSEPKELILIFEPKWYQTWQFRLFVILCTAALIYAFFRYRLSQIKKQHEIRRNIANDLHDDLGSTLNSVKIFTNLAISGVKQEENLQQVKENLHEATMGLRDMLWVLDDSLDTVDELVTRLKQFAIPVANASNMQVEILSGPGVNDRKLTKEEKRNLFLICKEAVNNAVKYSGASLVTISITPAGKKIQILISDNGKGFDITEVKKGYGLKNMEYRAGQVNYSIKLTSSMKQGTQISIHPI
jgi:hypothetical protein